MRFCALVSAICILTSSGLARTPGFNPKDVVRQVRSVHSTPGSLEPLNPSRDNGEFLVDTSGTHGEWGPAVASDGANFLVVWSDLRSGEDIYGCRVTPEGIPLDPQAIPISTAANEQEYPAVAFDGTNFLVVWEDYRDSSDGPDIYGCRVTPGGDVLDRQGIPISTEVFGQRSAAVSFGGASFLVVWADWRNDGDIYGCRVTPEGTALDPQGIPISTAAWSQGSPALAFDGTNFLVVWVDWRTLDYDIYGARVTPQGTVLEPQGIPISLAAGSQYPPAVAFDGANFLAAWGDYRGETWDIYGARVTPQGTVPDPQGFVISQAAYNQESPTIGFDGANFLAVWEDYRGGAGADIYGARVTPAGMVFDSGPVASQEGEQVRPELCRRSGGTVFLVYQGWAGTVNGKVYGTDRIWGKMDPNPAIAEFTKPEVRMTNSGPTVVRGVLSLEGDCPRTGTVPKAVLLDIAGRRALDLHPGPNDVSRLSPGVYFAREEPQAASHKPQAVRKVVVAR